MYRKAILSAILVCAIFFLHGGCASRKMITRRSQLAVGTGRITVLAKDGSLYELHQFQLQDSLLIGTGHLKEGYRHTPFSGQLNLSDIDYILAHETDILKGLLAIGAGVVVGGMALSVLGEETGLSFRSTTGVLYASCPFVYTYDGTDYHFESETFAGAIFESAERASFDVVEHLRPVDGKYLLKVTNERLESDYWNELGLLVVDSPPDVKVIPDSRGDLHTIASPVPPRTCFDFEGKDALVQVLDEDSLLWESDLPSKDFTKDENLRDGLLLEFQKPSGAREAKLVVTGVNTALGSFALELLCTLRGGDILRWYQQLENEPVERAKLIEFMMREGMLHVKVMQNGMWVDQTPLMDVGPMVEKEQIAILDLTNVPGETVRIKLESTTDLWRINHVYMDYSQDAPVEVVKAELSTATDESRNDVADLLRSDDDLYYATIPGQLAHVTFNEVPKKPGMKRWYVVKSKGYYHLWAGGRGEPKDELVDRILTEPLYAARMYMPLWRNVKNQYEQRSWD